MRRFSRLVAVFVVLVKATAAPAQAPAHAAVVNGEPILLSELEAVLKDVPPAKTTPTAAQQRQLRADALDLLIDDVLVRQFFKARGPKISGAECDQELATLQASLKAKNATLADFLRDSHQTVEQLRLEITKKLQWDRYVKEIVTEPALQRYYEENRDYYDRVTVQASHILLRLQPSARAEDRRAARERLESLRQRILAGELDFAEAARKHSQCQSACKGGDIGYFPRKWAVDEQIAKTAFALPVGQVSDVVQTEFGLHLIKVTARKPGKPSTFDAVKDEVRRNYAMELWHDVIAQQRKVAKIETKLP